MVWFSLAFAFLRPYRRLRWLGAVGWSVLRASRQIPPVQNLIRIKVSVQLLDSCKSSSQSGGSPMGYCAGIFSILVSPNRRAHLRTLHHCSGTGRSWAVEFFGTVFAYPKGMSAHEKDQSANESTADGQNGDAKRPGNVRVDRSGVVATSNNLDVVTAPHLKVRTMAGAGTFLRFMS